MKINLWYEDNILNDLKSRSQPYATVIKSHEDNINRIGDIYNFGKILFKLFKYSPKLQKELQPTITNKFINQDILDNNEYNIYPISLCGIGDIITEDQTVVDIISKEALEYIINNQLTILICWGTEGWNFPLEPFLKLQDEFENKGIDVTKIKFISGNNLIKDTIKEKSEMMGVNLRFQFFGFQLWELFHRKEIENNDGYYGLKDLIVQKQIKHKKIKSFLNLNANIRWHRLAMVSLIHNNEKIKKSGLYSFLGRDYGYEMTAERYLNDEALEFVSIDFFKNNKRDKNNFINYIKNWSPISLDVTPEEIENNDRIFTTQIYKDTLFSLVSESEYQNEVFFVTEKTWKPISSNHPFIIFGNNNILSYLKNLGYETFPEIFDETYDTMNNHNKIYHIFKILKGFSEMTEKDYNEIYYSLKDKLSYNSNHFFNRDMSKESSLLLDFIFHRGN